MATETFIKSTSSFSLPIQGAVTPKRRDVTTILNYYKDPCDGTPPTPVYVGGATVTNERPIAPTQVVVHDVFGEEEKYTLDMHGFQFIKHKSIGGKFDDDEWVKTAYYQESANVYKNILEALRDGAALCLILSRPVLAATTADRYSTGASSVHLFGHLVRRGPTHWHKLGEGNAAKKGPLHRVHIDQSCCIDDNNPTSYAGAELVLRKQLGEAAAASVLSSGKRWQIINLWRPITTIYKDPLAVAAAASIPESDLIEAQVIYTNQSPPLNMNVTWTILPNETHEWYYRNEQGPDDVLLIKCFDSEEERVARRAPHCAFVDPERDGEEWTDRESVEIRALVFYDQ